MNEKVGGTEKKPNNNQLFSKGERKTLKTE